MPSSARFSRLIRLALSFFGMACLCMAAQQHALATDSTEKEVHVYNWTEYIPDSVLADFTKKTGIKVIYTTFETSEAMYRGVKAAKNRHYDVVVPSGYYVDILRRAGYLQKIDHSRIANLDNLDFSIMDRDFDPENRYSIPYMWGAVGLAYNTKHIPKGTLTRWTQLQDPRYKGKILMTDDLRDALGLAMLAQGRSSNSRQPADIKAGYEFLVKLKPSIRIFDVTATKDALINEDVWLAPMWNGDYLVAKEKKPELDYVFPDEGAVLWVDSFVIPVGAKNVDHAYAFINYMLRPEVAAECVKEYRYSTPNLAARKLLPAALRNNP
ncbi:spermidine/putrescine ABC transporter substrate-binding protein, partial [Oxalobacter sp. OttesenSCG-928-P03]|nr:spermidine/putrescine ABC transporter substrate-binding protein [Oxalobacter sp. OttesenSCG-928-P03]